MSTRRALMQLLSDGQFHSGESLGHQLGLSRAAVWKQIQAAQAEGLNIDSAQARGYCLLSHVELLESELILAEIPLPLRDNIRLSVFEELDSTNTYLMQLNDHSNHNEIHVCLAEKQTAGRGRRGRDWQSPYGTSLAMSIRCRFNADAGRLSGLSLATGVAIAECLENMGVKGIQLKWPNDLLIYQRKLAGILIELSGDVAGPCDVVLGLGMNISTSTTNEQAGMSAIDQPWTDLISQHTATSVSRNLLASQLIIALCHMLQCFEAQGFVAYQRQYTRRDALYQQAVTVQHPSGESKSFTGIANGIDEHGALLVQSDNGLHQVTAGEVSVRHGIRHEETLK